MARKKVTISNSFRGMAYVETVNLFWNIKLRQPLFSNTGGENYYSRTNTQAAIK
jgi:hypothetical protein